MPVGSFLRFPTAWSRHGQRNQVRSLWTTPRAGRGRRTPPTRPWPAETKSMPSSRSAERQPRGRRRVDGREGPRAWRCQPYPNSDRQIDLFAIMPRMAGDEDVEQLRDIPKSGVPASRAGADEALCPLMSPLASPRRSLPLCRRAVSGCYQRERQLPNADSFSAPCARTAISVASQSARQAGHGALIVAAPCSCRG